MAGDLRIALFLIMPRHIIPTVAFVLLGTPFLYAQDRGATVSYLDKVNTRVDPALQQELRSGPAWQAFVSQHPGWSAEFDVHSGLPRSAYGPPMVADGATPEERALRFFAVTLSGFQFPIEDLVHRSTVVGRSTYVHFTQRHAGLDVFGSHAMVKLDAQHRVIAFRLDVVQLDAFQVVRQLDGLRIEAAWEGLVGVDAWELDGSCWVALPERNRRRVHQAARIIVHTKGDEVPGRFFCLVDLDDGALLYRSNTIVSCGPPMNASVSVSGHVYTGSPLGLPEVRDLPNVRATIGGTTYHADENGVINVGGTGPFSATFELRSPWANVSTLNVTPSFTTSLSEGENAISFNEATTIQQRSAYRYVYEMRRHMAAVLPSFTGLNYAMPVRVDLVSPNCNAFYDGEGINFYEQGNNCRSLATIDDVVYHEYAHGINDKYYGALGSTFINGAMDEGYADVWALSLAEDLIFGEAVRLDFAGSAIRRYDGVPKVYPVDILGDRHNDGQIIAGAWMDLYQALGNDMPLMLALFKEAYAGLQATAPNGNEGRAFRDVLLDVLQADDDDGDITNGTPNAPAIIAAFARHGITLISDVRIEHATQHSADAGGDIALDASVIATFPSTAYIDGIVLRYRVNAEQAWTEVPMTMGETHQNGTIPAHEAGTVVHYHIAVRDINGYFGAVHPAGADLIDPRLAHTILVGLEPKGTEDADTQHAFGPWTFGQPGDNAVRGLWAEGIPIPSYAVSWDPATICQPGTQHTPGGTDCWFTANATSAMAPVGEQDVDGGSTSLVSPVIDLSVTQGAVISYWRWYTNAPPTGTNPGQDLWQVFASGDAGATWVPVEATRRSDRAWRRNAFRVADVLGDVPTIRMKFVASDSLLTDVDQGGGSLVEAAIDDLRLWGTDITIAVDEKSVDSRLRVWPVPAREVVHVRSGSPWISVDYEVLDMTGRVIHAGSHVAAEVLAIPVADLSTGHYVLRLIAGGQILLGRFSVAKAH